MVIEQRRDDNGSTDRILGELIAEVRDLRSKVEKLEESVVQLTAIKDRGMGMISLVMVTAGAAGAIVWNMLQEFMRK